jgi:hypothetical protein
MSRTRFKDGCIVTRVVPSGKWKFLAFWTGVGFMNVYRSVVEAAMDWQAVEKLRVRIRAFL